MDGRRRTTPCRLGAGSFALLVLGAACGGEAADGPAPAETLVAAERAFAQTSVDEGTRTAFLGVLADEAVIFRPRPTPARAHYEATPESRGRLSWEPTVADVSAAGDLGYTSGPYVYQEDGRTAHGHYVSVWRRAEDGPWRLVLDVGVPHPEPGAAGSVQIPSRDRGDPGAGLTPAGVAAARVALADADAALGEIAATEGAAAVYQAAAAPSLRFYRAGAPPSVGLDAALARVGEAPASWRPLGGGVARSGDLGYTYGLAAWQPARGAGPDSTSYLRLWRRRADGNWMLVLDLAAPIP
ncbi:MAG: nuclear transport factor 2 family protein [Rhodothermales bacterium]|nr:nuclear transport factor 2 family protein [Rhodothermales bacterium]